MKKNININKDHAELVIDGRIYSKENIFAAGYIFLDRAYIILDQDKNKFIVHIYPRDKRANLKVLSFDFYNELLNYAHYFSRVKANAAAIKIIMQRALFSAAPSLVEEAQDKEIQELIEQLEEEEKHEQNKSSPKRKR